MRTLGSLLMQRFHVPPRWPRSIHSPWTGAALALALALTGFGGLNPSAQAATVQAPDGTSRTRSPASPMSAGVSGSAADTRRADVYRMWDWGETSTRTSHEFEALRLALDKTMAEHGPFTIIRHVDRYSTLRIRREVNQGTLINVQAGPWRGQYDIPPGERNIAINVPVLRGTLGCRRLIVRRADLPAFARITSSDQLKRLTAGMGRGWLDVQIMRHNGYKVDDSGNVSTLVAMLATRRFDYLHFSAIEVEDVLARSPELAANMAIVPNLQIYYPLPVIFYVSPKAPALAARLRKGLLRASRDGTLERAFTQAFPHDVCGVKDPAMRHFILANPHLPANSALDARLFPPP